MLWKKAQFQVVEKLMEGSKAKPSGEQRPGLMLPWQDIH